MDLGWTDNATNETGFAVERSLNGTSGWTQVATLGVHTGTGSMSCTDTNLTAQTIYYYRVKATGSGGDSAYAGPVNATTTSFPIITVGATTTNLTFSFQTVTGKTYIPKQNTATPSLSDTGWINVASQTIVGDGTVKSFTAAKPASGKIFYTIEYTQ